MLCQECHRAEANIHIVKHVNGKQTELNLCEKCARRKEELDFTFEPQFSLHKLFTSMLNQGLIGAREEKEAAALQCTACKLTFTQFGQIGRLGCGSCVAAFEERLKPLLRRIHAGTTHTGKIPARARIKVNRLRELDKLKGDLQQKVQNEEFEEAALLRDQIRAMEKELSAENKGEKN